MKSISESEQTLRVKQSKNVSRRVLYETVLILVLHIPVLQDLFRFGDVPPLDLLASAGAGVLSILWFELFKYMKKI